MAEIYYKPKSFNKFIAGMPGVQNEIRSETERIGRIADRKLAALRASSPWVKIADPSGLTKITTEYGGFDGFINLEAYKMGAMALEYGHEPSGVFGPNGKLSHVKVRPSRATYLMTTTFVQA